MTDQCVYMKLLEHATRLEWQDSWSCITDSTRAVERRDCLGSVCLAGFTDRQVGNSICTVLALCMVPPIVILDAMVLEQRSDPQRSIYY
jgi:hypothetical protein